MAIGATCVWEMRDTGAATNGGGYVSGGGGTDYSQQDAAQYTTSSATTSGAGAVILWAAAASDMVGNILYIASGTNFTVGWYQVTSISAGVSVTVDRNCCSGAGSSGVINVGGAWTFGSSLEDSFFEQIVAGNKIWVKNGTYTLSAAVAMATTISSNGNAAVMEGYNSTRGDVPLGDTRPLFALGANAYGFTVARWDHRNIRFTTTAANGVQSGGLSIWKWCKCINSSTTAGRFAFSAGSFANLFLFYSEGISYRGSAFYTNSSTCFIEGCNLHNSLYGLDIFSSTSALVFMNNTIVYGNTSRAVNLTATTAFIHLNNCTLYGAESTIGVGVNGAANARYFEMWNCSISGFTTGINQTDSTANTIVEDYNNFYNNDTNRTNAATGAHSTTNNPSFTSVGEMVNTGTVTAGASDNTITDTGANFSTLVAGVHYFNLISGTNCTAGIYGITTVAPGADNTKLVLDLDPTSSSTGSSIVYSIVTGLDFSPGTGLKAGGHPGAFPGGYSTGYLDQGAVQRQEPAGGAAGLMYRPNMAGNV